MSNAILIFWARSARAWVTNLGNMHVLENTRLRTCVRLAGLRSECQCTVGVLPRLNQL